MGRFKTNNPMITTSVRISPEFHQIAKKHGINFTEALRVGLSLMFAEREISDYDNDLNLYRKMRLFQKELEKKSIELEELKGRINDSNEKQTSQ